MILFPAKGLNIPALPANPTKDELERAKDLILDELLVTFPLREIQSAHMQSHS